MDRFSARGDDAERPWRRQVQEIVNLSGGVRHLEEMHDRLSEVLRSRPTAIVVQSEVGEIQGTYNQVLEALEDEQSAPTP